MLQTIGEWGSFTFIALALGLDGFSVCLAIGIQNLRWRRIISISLLIGFFHMVLLFTGLYIGTMMALKWATIAVFIGGTLLTFIGLYIIFSSFQIKQIPPFQPFGIQLISLALFVSIDSFPVSISLGLSGVRTIFIIFLFGMITTMLALIGLMIGKRTSQWFGIYSELVSGLILFLFGLFVLFS